MTKLLILFLARALLSQSFELRTGVALGKVEAPVNRSKRSTVTMGGLVLGGNFVKDFDARWAFSGGGDVLIDIPNRQIARQGGFLGCTYHLLGSPYQLTHRMEPDVIFQESSRQQLSLILQGAFHSYSASSSDLSVTLEGSVFDIRSGLAYRFQAITYAVVATLFSLPTNANRLQTRGVEAVASFRL